MGVCMRRGGADFSVVAWRRVAFAARWVWMPAEHGVLACRGALPAEGAGVIVATLGGTRREKVGEGGRLGGNIWRPTVSGSRGGGGGGGGGRRGALAIGGLPGHGWLQRRPHPRHQRSSRPSGTDQVGSHPRAFGEEVPFGSHPLGWRGVGGAMGLWGR